MQFPIDMSILPVPRACISTFVFQVQGMQDQDILDVIAHGLRVCISCYVDNGEINEFGDVYSKDIAKYAMGEYLFDLMGASTEEVFERTYSVCLVNLDDILYNQCTALEFFLKGVQGISSVINVPFGTGIQLMIEEGLEPHPAGSYNATVTEVATHLEYKAAQEIYGEYMHVTRSVPRTESDYW